MSLVTAEHVEHLIRAATTNLNTNINARLNEFNARINEFRPVVVAPYQPVVIDPAINSANHSLDLIKSLPEFNGNPESYPAWRAAATFAMEYYPENSEKFYVATGVLRNKITSSANSTLSAFNTVLNYKAILARLDQSYSDKRPLHVLENELSILRQDNSSIIEFYDKVDKQLTLIINKQIMTLYGQDLIDAFNQRARENALRVFISGLRRPLCDILFSSKPIDLPSALVTAQELETNHKRNDFARAFAAGTLVRSNKPKTYQNFNHPINKPVPMDVDSSKIHQKNNIARNYPDHRTRQNQAFPNIFRQNNFQSFGHPNQNFSGNTPQQFPNYNSGAIPKRTREISDSSKSPFHKQQRINHLPDLRPISEGSDTEETQSDVSDVIDDISNHEVNFLG